MAYEKGTPGSRLVQSHPNPQLPIHPNPLTPPAQLGDWNWWGLTHKHPHQTSASTLCTTLEDCQKQRQDLVDYIAFWGDQTPSEFHSDLADIDARIVALQAGPPVSPTPPTPQQGWLDIVIEEASNFLNTETGQEFQKTGKDFFSNWGKGKIKELLALNIDPPQSYGINTQTGGFDGMVSHAQPELPIYKRPTTTSQRANTTFANKPGGALPATTPVKYWMTKTNLPDAQGKWAYVQFGQADPPWGGGAGYVQAVAPNGQYNLLRVRIEKDGNIEFSKPEAGSFDLEGMLPMALLGVGAYLLWQAMSDSKSSATGLGSAGLGQRSRAGGPSRRRTSNRSIHTKTQPRLQNRNIRQKSLQPGRRRGVEANRREREANPDRIRQSTVARRGRTPIRNRPTPKIGRGRGSRKQDLRRLASKPRMSRS